MEEDKKTLNNPSTDEQAIESAEGAGALWARHGQRIILGGILIYLALLLIGVVAELFNIESVLNWWIWSPPGSKSG
jgi:hypothetical protein